MWLHSLTWVFMSILGLSQPFDDFNTFSVDAIDVFPNNKLVYLPRKNSSGLSNSSYVSSILTIDTKCMNPSISARAITFGNDLFISLNDKIIGYCNDGINNTNRNDLINPSLVNCSDVVLYDLSNITQNNKSLSVINISVGLTTDALSTSMLNGDYGSTIWMKSVFGVLFTVNCDENDESEPVQRATDKLSICKNKKKPASKKNTRKNNKIQIDKSASNNYVNVMS